MTPPPNPAAAAEPLDLPHQQPPAAAVQAPAQSTLWILPAVIVLSAFFFTYATVPVFEFRPATALLAGYAIWGIAAFIVLGTLPRKPPLPLESPISKAILGFIAAVAFSTTLVVTANIRADSDKLIPQTMALLFMTLPFFVLQAAAMRTNPTRVILLTSHVVLGISALSVLGDFVGVTSYERGDGRYFGFLGDGVAWALTFPMLVYFCGRRLVLAAACLICLGLTGSRAPAICVAAALALLVAFSRGKRLQYIVLLGLLVVIAAYQSEMFMTLMERLSGTELMSNSRLTTAGLGLTVFEHSPLFGSGYNAQAYYFPDNARRNALGLYAIQTSTFVQMLAEGGLIVFAAYAALLLTVSIGAIRLLRSAPGDPSAGLIVGAIVWLLSMMWVNQSAAWFLVGSYLGPLIFGTAGVISGYYAHLRFARRQALSGSVPADLR